MTSNHACGDMLPVDALGPELVQQWLHDSWQRPVISSSTERIPATGDVAACGMVAVLMGSSRSRAGTGRDVPGAQGRGRPGREVRGATLTRQSPRDPVALGQAQVRSL
ncbi:hypothetical protein Sdagh_13660 [Streptomyces daghestanicus]|uniref:Uncharacterized protein n=1 Tax=Streptomyces daghestanicus TaxID=66885 RepID=A0ABQ3PX80_9ACTN|nr:hypothetical protein Sdagh_13660 [Streptomyces daghestanicus]